MLLPDGATLRMGIALEVSSTLSKLELNKSLETLKKNWSRFKFDDNPCESVRVERMGVSALMTARSKFNLDKQV